MTIEAASRKLIENQNLIGSTYQGAAIADILIIPKGVGNHYVSAIEELSEQEEDYSPLLNGFKKFTLMVTFAHPYLQAISLDAVLAKLL